MIRSVMDGGRGQLLALDRAPFTIGILASSSTARTHRSSDVVELILLAVTSISWAFSSFLRRLVGQVFALMVMTVAAAEAAIGLPSWWLYPSRLVAVEDITDGGAEPSMYQAIVFLFPLLGASSTPSSRSPVL